MNPAPPPTPLPDNHGVVLYYGSAHDSANWVYLAGLTPQQPSKIVRTNWESNDELRGAHSVTLGISIEPIDTINNLNEAVEDDASTTTRNKSFGVRVARDLFNFMASFNTNSNTSYMTVPTNILERWVKRFEEKYERNPRFFLE